MSVPVEGGALRVGRWGDEGGPVVLAVHGITATHVAWMEVAARLPAGITLLAPDLRGRGRSADLPAPYGFAAHVRDLLAVLDAVGAERAVLAGHSMGGFLAVALAAHHPDRVSRLVLVEGGPPLGRPEDQLPAGGIDALLGPAAARLEMTFPSREAYHEFWRAHPAFGPMWGPAVEAYVDYDLVGDPPRLRSSCRPEAMRVDGAEVNDHAATTDAFARMSRTSVPATLLRAERGLLDEPRAFYPVEALARWHPQLAGPRLRTVPDTNHYSILLAAAGADAVAAAITEAVAPAPGAPVT